MANFTTGTTLLADIGVLNYNGCTFSPLFESSLSGAAVKDEANRTVKLMEISLTVDGYVTLMAGTSISPTMKTMQVLLLTQGGPLTYTGRGYDIIVNQGVAPGIQNFKPTAVPSDVAWGPVPELLEFQPLGGGLSAKVKWKVTVRLPVNKAGAGFTGVGAAMPLLQFNYDTGISYAEDGFSTLSMHGTLEIPMTRILNGSNIVPRTADDFRPVIQRQLLAGIDLTRFRVIHREFNTSRDKRTLTWDFAVEEKPYMDLPPNCTVARGTFNVKPARAGPSLCLWMCSLNATYTLRKDVDRREAYLLFLALLRLRMAQAYRGNIPKLDKGDQQGDNAPKTPLTNLVFGNLTSTLLNNALSAPPPARKEAENVLRPTLMDFTVSEGLYLDSKSVTFSAVWRMSTSFSHILIASGVWTKINEKDANGNNLWATSIKDVAGTTSWLANRLDNTLDVIVDFGSSQ